MSYSYSQKRKRRLKKATDEEKRFRRMIRFGIKKGGELEKLNPWNLRLVPYVAISRHGFKVRRTRVLVRGTLAILMKGAE